MTRATIDCQKLSKTYRNGSAPTTVLHDVSLRVDSGEFLAVIGPSGSGKSTLMHLLGALDSPTTGTYRLDGQDISTLSDDNLALIRSQKIGFVFQAFNLLPRASVVRNVELPLLYSRLSITERQSRVETALRQAGLDEARWQNRSNQLSGGQMQRVAIARALVNNPSILLADEPTGNLDQKTGRVVLKTFQQLNDAGRTIILITHDQYVAEHASRIIRLEDGRILSDEPNHHRRAGIKETV